LIYKPAEEKIETVKFSTSGDPVACGPSEAHINIY